MLPVMDDEFETRRPFRRRDGLAAGLTPSELRGPRFRLVAHGVYAAAEVADLPLVRAQAVVLLFPGRAIASHATAARVHEAPLPPLPEEHVTVLTPADRRYHAGIRTHVARTTGSDSTGPHPSSWCRSAGGAGTAAGGRRWRRRRTSARESTRPWRRGCAC